MRQRPAAPSMHHRARRRCQACSFALMLSAACGVLAAISVAAGPATSSASVRIATAQLPTAIADFELVDQDGKHFSFSQLRGGPALVFFGFTHCPDVCPSTLAKLVLLIDSADMRIHSIPVVMISVDGNRDSPEVMKAYLAQLSPRCIGLTGDPGAVRRIAAQFSAAFFKGFPDKPGGPYLVQHSSQIYLVDRHGRLRASFSDASTDAMRQAAISLTNEAHE